MITGNSYLQGDLCQDLGGRIRGGEAWSSVGSLAAETTITGFTLESERRAPTSSVTRTIPLRGLEPGVLDDVNDDVDDYATHCLTSTTLESLFDAVIATAEMRAGEPIVRTVLASLAASRDGLTLAELSSDDDTAISVAHVLSILGNHVHCTHQHYRLTPMLRSAVERRYPLRHSPARGAVASTLRADHAAIAGSIYRRAWRQSA